MNSKPTMHAPKPENELDKLRRINAQQAEELAAWRDYFHEHKWDAKRRVMLFNGVPTGY